MAQKYYPLCLEILVLIVLHDYVLPYAGNRFLQAIVAVGFKTRKLLTNMFS